MAFLNKGLRISLIDQRVLEPVVGDEITGETIPGDVPEDVDAADEMAYRQVSYCYERGLPDYVEYLDATKRVTPLHADVIDLDAENDAGTMSLELAMRWTSSYTETLYTYANTINTSEGGAHEEGFRAALTTIVNKYGRDKSILRDKDENYPAMMFVRG